MSQLPEEPSTGVASTDGRDALPAHTTPTWEMELLVSGATVFGLLQLPRLLDLGYFRVLNLFPGGYAKLVMPLWIYAKVAVITLVLTFVAHLCLRGYWVALVGLDSVYPGGVRPEKLGLGPIARENLETTLERMSVVIERADNRATRVFGVGFGFAMAMLVPVLVMSLSLAAAVSVALLLGERYAMIGFWIAIAVVAGPWMLGSMLDNRAGARLSRSPRAKRAVARLLDVYGRFGFGPRSNPLVSLFASNAGRARTFATVLAVMLPVVFLVLLQLSLAKGDLPFGMDIGIEPGDPFSPSTTPAAFYGDERGEDLSITPLPFLPSRIATGPYVPLYVPFIPRRHTAPVRAGCPLPAGEPDDTGRDASARLACIAGMLDIRIDGAPVPVRLDASTDADTGQPGLIAMLPIAALAAGRHEVSLNEPPRTEPGEPVRRYRIAFWK